MRRLRRSRAAAVVLGTAMLASLAACAASDPITVGERPNSPTAVTPSTPSSETDPAKLSLDLSTLPGFTAPTSEGGGVFSRSILDTSGKVTWKVLDGSNQVIENYDPDQQVAFGDSSTYTKIPGVLTFRGNNYRDAPVYGRTDVTQKRLQVAWTQDTGDVYAEGSHWAGAGWTGQPLLVNWPTATKEAMGLSQAQIDDPNFVEVIYPVVDGNVYRLDLATGTQTKPPIDVGWAFKGTGSIDPRGYPLLYSGMGLNQNGEAEGTWRYRIFDLIQNKEVSGWDGSDPGAPRDWGAFDSSSLVNAATDTLIEPAENGLIYKVKLNAKFDAAAKTVSVDPEFTKLDYNTPESSRHGIEGSAAAYRNLMYAGDNDGNIVCWDATTLQVVWVRPTGDDTDASIVLEDDNGTPFLYTGNEMDKRGEGTNGASHGTVTIQKLNALTGAVVWKYEIDAVYNKAVNGGLMATPVLGTGEVSDLAIFNIAKTGSDKQGTLVALDKKTGTVVWKRTLAHFGWSSPLLLTGTDGHSYGVVGDSSGLLHLFNPNTGQDYSTLQLSQNIEASPAVYGNMLVVGTYAEKLYGIRIS
ncbi:MAG: PQQ-binding-like beta-propeller repeat protein [Propionicimonas sp.]|uniref:outer membrane protein assembly factor BamB family protein n=1 Tax=Propionicimonas sp. TaxID=1955623 RepID=UPI003D0BC995